MTGKGSDSQDLRIRARAPFSHVKLNFSGGRFMVEIRLADST